MPPTKSKPSAESLASPRYALPGQTSRAPSGLAGLLPGLSIGGLLFLGLAIQGLAAEDPAAIWTTWLPLPISIGAIAVAVLESEVAHRHRGLMRAAMLIVGLAALRLAVATAQPIAHAGIRETIELLAAGACALGLALSVRRRESLVYAVWIGALVSIVAARLFLPSAHPLFRPDLSAAILSIPFALFMLSDAARRRRSKAPPLRPRAIVARHSCAIALGAAVAAMSVGYARSAPSEDPLAHSRSERAAEWLWAQSALFGWGRGPMERLTGVLTEPAPAPTPLWGGWRRSLAAHGLTAALAGALLSLFLLRRALAARESERAAAAQWALPAAQAALALLFLGRPDSSVPALVAAGWIGLGLGGVASGVAPPRPATSARHAADITIWSASSFGALALLTAAALAAAAPTWSASIVASVRPQDLTDPALARRLEWARTLNPRNPEVERMEALRLRQRIDASRWDEALFDRARDAYRRAIALDPHEPALALNLADIEREAGREEDALATVYRSRSLNPRSMELIEWLYIFGAARGRSDLTERAVARGLQVEPDSPLWWRRRLALEVRASEIQSDSVARAESLALSAAIGGAPGEAAPIIRAAFARRR